MNSMHYCFLGEVCHCHPHTKIGGAFGASLHLADLIGIMVEIVWFHAHLAISCRLLFLKVGPRTLSGAFH